MELMCMKGGLGEDPAIMKCAFTGCLALAPPTLPCIWYATSWGDMYGGGGDILPNGLMLLPLLAPPPLALLLSTLRLLRCKLLLWLLQWLLL